MRDRGASVRMVLLVPVVLLLGSLAAGSFPQADLREKGVEALIAEHVKGQPAETEAALRALLSQAKGDQRWPALARLVLLLERSGRGGDGDQTAFLQELAEAPDPWGGWGRARRQAPGGKPQEVKNAPQDPIVGLVHCWAAGDTKSAPPIARLGSLAVPEVLRQIEKFGATTLRPAIAFLAQHADPSVLRAFAAMLESSDPVRQVAVADALAALPPASAKPLVETALRSAHPAIKFGALRALAQTDETQRVVTELGTMARDASETQCQQIVTLLTSDRLAADTGARKLLEELAPRSHAALGAWVEQRGPGDEAMAEAMLGGLSGELRSYLLALVLERSLPWRKLLLVAAAEADHAFDALRCLEKHGMELPREPLIRLLRGSEDHYQEVLAMLRRHPEIDASAEMAALLAESLDDSGRGYVVTGAVNFLKDRSPRALLPLAGRLMWVESFVDFLLQHGDASVIGAVVAHLRPLDLSPQDGTWRFAPLTRLVWHRSEAANLADVLRLVSLPASRQGEASFKLKAEAVTGALQRWFGPQDVDGALSALGKVEWTVELRLLEHVARFVTTKHLTALENLLAENLAKLQPATTPRALQSLDEPLPARGRSLHLIRTIGVIEASDAAAVLENLLDHADSQVAAAACQALLAAKTADRRAVARRVLSNERAVTLVPQVLAASGWVDDAELRKLAARRLAQWPADQDPADSDEYAMVAQFLAALPADERRVLATAILERGSAAPPWLACKALTALGGLGDASLIPTLAIGLRHPREFVRQETVTELGRTGSLEAVPHLLEALKDEQVQEGAKAALERLSTYFEEKQKWEQRFGVKPAGEKK